MDKIRETRAQALWALARGTRHVARTLVRRSGPESRLYWHHAGLDVETLSR